MELQTNEFDYLDDDKQKRKGNGKIIIILLVIFFLLSVTIVGVVFLYAGKGGIKEMIEPEKEVMSTGVTYSQEQVDGMLAVAVNEAKEAAASETKEELLTSMRDMIQSEEGVIGMLKAYYPNEIIFYDKDGYNFMPILATVAKNSLSLENFSLTETGVMQYTNENNVVSHFGIDVSTFQKKIDWAKVASQGVEYAFIRMGYRGYGNGKLVTDAKFQDNIAGASANGVKVGVYFFTQALNIEEAIEEANYVIENISGYTVDYPIVIDVEDISEAARTDQMTQQELTDVAIAFMDRIKEAGYTPMIYANLRYFTKILDIERLEGYEKWFAYYNDKFYFPYDLSVWQYTDKGHLDGIDGVVDFNISFKTW